jgi:hypothetical protein
VTVDVLLHETNPGRSDPSDGYIEAITSTKPTRKPLALPGSANCGMWAIRSTATRIPAAKTWEHNLVVEAHDVYNLSST